MRWMFEGCSSLKKENVKISESGKKLLDEECWEDQNNPNKNYCCLNELN